MVGAQNYEISIEDASGLFKINVKLTENQHQVLSWFLELWNNDPNLSGGAPIMLLNQKEP